MPGKRRSRFTIMAQILKTAKEGTLKTHIMYKASLSFAQVNDYLSLLKKVDLLKVRKDDRRTIFKTTSRGVKYLKNFSKIKSLLRKPSQHNPL